MSDGYVFRDIDPSVPEETALVAERMRLTLVEVLGEEAGGSMYTTDWLVQRVRFHLDPAQCRGRVVVVEGPDGAIAGHAILRHEADDGGGLAFGLFSTFYVDPAHRRRGIADRLVTLGEAWFREAGLGQARTYTAESNAPLHCLMYRHGYVIALRKNDMVSLQKELV